MCNGRAWSCGAGQCRLDTHCVDMPPRPKNESEREWCRQLVERLVERLDRTLERCPPRTTFALMEDLNDDMGISAHGRVHVRDSEDKLVEPCQIGRENVTVAMMRDLSAGFQSFSGAHTF